MDRSNLPIPLSSLVGRGDEIAAVKRLLPTTRLLTLTGVGGCGKTRLALAAAEELAPEYADGVWLVEFAPLVDPALVPQTLARVLRVPERTDQPLIEVLVEHLQPRCTLLVFDNCEHLVLACARLAEALLRACPHLQILCTSREPLGLTGEAIYLVPLLSTPNPHDPPGSLAGYMQFEAVQLFVERAVAAQPSFVLSERNSGAVADLCCRLEGIPLAIELAAARVRALPAEEIAARLDDSFRLLTGGSRTAAPRQQTLQAALDWSYALLTPTEQSLLKRLSTFAGGWTLSAAEAVCQEAGEPVFDLLARLVDKSLVVANVVAGEPARYRLLEPVRQYAHGRLAAAEDLACTRDRHLRFYLAFAETAAGQLLGPEQVAWLQSLEADHDNIRAGFAWARERNEAARPDDLREASLRLANALPWFWRMHGHVSEGRRWLAAALRRSENAPTLLRAAALVRAAFLAIAQSDFTDGARLAEESLALYRSIDDRAGIAWSLRNLATVAGHRDDYASAEALTEESLRLYQQAADRHGVAGSQYYLGELALNQGNFERARQVLEQSLAAHRELGDGWGTAYSLNLLGLANGRLQDYDAAQAYLAQALPIWEEMGDRRGRAHCSEFLAEVKQGTGDLTGAGDCYVEALALFQQVGNKWSMAQCLQKLGTVACMQQQWERATRLMGAGDVLHQAIGAPVNPADRDTFDCYVHDAREALGSQAFAAIWQAGQAMTIEEAVAYARAQPEAREQRVVGHPRTPLQTARDQFDGLTAREREVARLIAQGKSNREIATELVVSERTAAAHVSSILSKLSLTSRTQVVAWAIARGLAR